MATAPLTVQSATYAGLTPSFTAAAGTGAGNGFTFTNDGSTYFRIKNANAGACTATLKAQGRSAAGIAMADQTFNVPATTGDVTIGNLPVADFGMTVTVEVSVSASVTAAAFK